MQTISAASTSFFQRIRVYFREMFPVLVYIPYIIALYFAMFFTVRALVGQPIVVDSYAIIGMISGFGMMMLLRTFDDLKDVDIDKELFPDRAIPRGDVLKSDIQILSVTTFMILVVVNIGWGRGTIGYFAIMMVYALLTFQWFFAEEYHRKHLFFTMATHQPLPYMVNFFLIQTALFANGVSYAFTWEHFIVLFLFSLPVTAWETGRKVRAVGHETEYETFSLLLGVKIATMIPFIAVLLTSACAFYIGWRLNLPITYFIICIALVLYASYVYMRFYRKPIPEYNILKNAALIYTTVLFFSLLGHLVYTSTIIFNF
jgi:hypothetical protein